MPSASHPADDSLLGDPSALAKYIDHTQLRPEATESDIRQACAEARRHGFKAVCTEARWLDVTVAELAGSSVLPIAVIAFPHGKGAPQEKAEEARLAAARGAREIDMVLNRERLKARDYAGVYLEIHAVVQAVGAVPVKVILETSELTDTEKTAACALAKAAGAQFVKTSTGFSKSGATEADVRLMRETVGEGAGVKASGGVRTREDAVRMIRAGASRIGTSGGVAIVSGGTAKGGSY